MGPCSRCGRDPRPDDAAWASLAGSDVCPTCQTPDERDAVLRRAVDAVKDEIHRRGREDEPPDPLEAPLINWALAAGERRHRVALTAAFFTNAPIEVHLQTRAAVYEQLAGECDKRPGWTAYKPDRRGTFETGGGFREPLPLIAARRGGCVPLEALREGMTGGSRTVWHPPDFALVPTRVEVDVYDLGIAVLAAWFDVMAPPEADVVELMRRIREVTILREPSPLVHALSGLAEHTAEQYQRLVSAAGVDVLSPWLAKHVEDERGRLLWLHPVHFVPEPLERVEPGLPDRHTTLRRDGGVFAPGVGWSVLAQTDAPNAIKLTKLHWAYYALYMEMDRGLLATLDAVRRQEQGTRVRDLDGDAREAFADYRLAMEARARLDSELSSLGGDELEIWEKIAEVQGFQPVVDGVERKLDLLRELTERHVELAEAARSRRVRVVLETLSVLAIVSLFVAAATYLIGGTQPSDADPIWRIVVVGAAVVVVAAVLLMLRWSEAIPPAARRRPWSRASSGRPPGGPTTS